MAQPLRRLWRRAKTSIALEILSHEESRRIYAALELLGGRDPSLYRPLGLSEFRVFSQNGEDGVVTELCRRLNIQIGRFVEFGAGDGRENNCVLLADIVGWSGLYMEGNPKSFQRLAAKYRNNACIETRHTFVTPENVNSLLSDMPRDLDILSIDVDGQDYWIWRALTVIKPKIVIIEYNSSLPQDRSLVEPPRSDSELVDSADFTSFFGASIAALEDLGRRKGYQLAYLELAGVNAFFIRDDLAEVCMERVTYRTPNYFLSGLGHQDDATGRNYVEPPAFL